MPRRSRMHIVIVLSIAALIALVAIAGLAAGRDRANGPWGLGPSGGTGVRLAAADGQISDGARVQPEQADLAAISHLDPALRSALIAAFGAAREGNVELEINSGWRSATLQQGLLDDAVRDRGSREAALEWVATPEASQHTKGLAVDIGPVAHVDWLDGNGYRFGLCRMYDNEPWHFERATSPGGTCPPRLATAAATTGVAVESVERE